METTHIIILVLVAAVIGLGWYWLNQHKKETKAVQNTAGPVQ